MRIKAAIVSVGLAAAPALAFPHVCIAGDYTAEDCVLDNIQKAKTDAALEAVVKARQSRYPNSLEVRTRIAPPCKDGKSVCEPWERDWSHWAYGSLPEGALVTPKGTVILPISTSP